MSKTNDLLRRFATSIVKAQAAKAGATRDRDVLGVFLGAACVLEHEHGADHATVRAFVAAMRAVREDGFAAVVKMTKGDAA